MPGLLMHSGAVMLCTHGVPAQIPPPPPLPRVFVTGMPVATMAVIPAVTGCPFTLPNGKPQPCLTVKWLMPSTRVLIMGTPAMLQPAPGPGAGLCQSPEQIPNGPPNVSTVQLRVIAM